MTKSEEKVGFAQTSGQSLSIAESSAISLLDTAIAAMALIFVFCLGIAVESAAVHWFLAPLYICGLLTGSDVIAWIRGRLDTFDPKALIGLLWLHGTCLAPLLHVVLGVHTPFYDSHVRNWPDWFGALGILNVVGLSFYKLGQRATFAMVRPTQTVWQIEPNRFFGLGLLAFGASAVASGAILLRFGGLSKSDQFFTALSGEAIHLSWLLMLGDPLPLIGTTLAVYAMSLGWRQRTLTLIIAILLALLAAEIALVGLRGSRTAILGPVFMGCALCHYLLRRIPVALVLCGIIVVGFGGYYYKFFKRFGPEGLQAITDVEHQNFLARRSGISPMGLLLGDLSRAEIQTFLLYQLAERGGGYRLRWGRTYGAAAMTFIPRAVWPNKPSRAFGKVAAGTELQYGQGGHRPGARESSRVYGPVGEVLLNFGALGVPMVYVALGSAMGWYRRKLASLPNADARFFLVPLFTMTFFIAAFGDADNTLFFLLKNGTLLIAIVLLSSVRHRAPSAISITRPKGDADLR